MVLVDEYVRARGAALAHIPMCPVCKRELCHEGERLRRRVLEALMREE